MIVLGMTVVSRSALVVVNFLDQVTSGIIGMDLNLVNVLLIIYLFLKNAQMNPLHAYPVQLVSIRVQLVKPRVTPVQVAQRRKKMVNL